MEKKKKISFLGQGYEAPHAECFGFENESLLLSSSIIPEMDGFSNEGFDTNTGVW